MEKEGGGMIVLGQVVKTYVSCAVALAIAHSVEMDAAAIRLVGKV